MAAAREAVQLIKDHLGIWLAEQSLGEHMVRVVEGLKHQRELIKTLIEQMDKRFDAMQKQMDKRFDAADKRFDAMRKQMYQRFDAVDTRFDALIRRIDRFMVWSFATTLNVAGLVVAALKLWP